MKCDGAPMKWVMLASRSQNRRMSGRIVGAPTHGLAAVVEHRVGEHRVHRHGIGRVTRHVLSVVTRHGPVRLIVCQNRTMGDDRNWGGRGARRVKIVAMSSCVRFRRHTRLPGDQPIVALSMDPARTGVARHRLRKAAPHRRIRIVEHDDRLAIADDKPQFGHRRRQFIGANGADAQANWVRTGRTNYAPARQPGRRARRRTAAEAMGAQRDHRTPRR